MSITKDGPISANFTAKRLHRLCAVAVVVLVAMTLWASPLAAEEAMPLEEPYATWENTAAVAQDVLEERKASTDALEKLRGRLVEHRKAAFEIAESGSVKVRTLQAQLDALGAPPAEGETETEEVAARRTELSKALATANLPIVASREAIESITFLRRLFSLNILTTL